MLPVQQQNGMPITTHGPLITIECFYFSSKWIAHYQPWACHDDRMFHFGGKMVPITSHAGHNDRMLPFQQQNGVPITSHRPVVTIEMLHLGTKIVPITNHGLVITIESFHFNKKMECPLPAMGGHNDRMLHFGSKMMPITSHGPVPFQQRIGVPITSHGPVITIECFHLRSSMECPLPALGRS